MFKNTDSQKVAIFAWDNANGEAKTGDAANITAQISIDGGATVATNDVNPTELDSTDAPGIYIFDMTQSETNGDLIVIVPISVTSDIVLRPVIIYTRTVMRGTDGANTIVPDAAGTAPTAVEINAEVVDVLKTDTKGEPAQGALGATLSIEDKIAYIYKFLRNKIWTTATEIKVYNNAGDVVDHKSTISDDNITFKRSKFESGP